MKSASRSAATIGIFALSAFAVACGSSAPASATNPSTDAGSDGSMAPEGGTDAGGLGPSSEAGTLSEAGDASVDSGHDGSGGVDAASGDDGGNDGSGGDHSCDGGDGCAGGCAVGYHSCATGCCAFGTKPILNTGTLNSIEGISCAVAADGTIHVLYLDATESLLVHAFGQGAAITVEGVATGAIVYVSLALDSTGEPVAIYETTSTLHESWTIDAQRRVGGAWSAITSVGGGSSYGPLLGMSTGVDATDNWNVLYSVQNPTQNTLYEQTFVGGDAGAWSSETLSYSPYDGFGFDSHATPYALWMDTSGTFDVAQPQSGTWTSRTYPVPPVSGTGMNAVLDSNGDPAVAVANGSTIAHYTGGSWSTDTTPLPAQQGAPFLAIDASGNPVVAQWDGAYIQIARRTPSGWETGMIGPTPTSRYPVWSVALDPSAGGAPVVCWVPYGTSSDPDDSVECSTW